ncbi:MAG: hypothetical protein IBJ15_23355, partial [Alphaproteobacteria bacterium]|nr:hypothetical protein [Alphaproteobacteria bacterium]
PAADAPANVSGTGANAPTAAAVASAAAPAALNALLPGLANILNAAAAPAVEAAVQPVLNELRGQLLDRLAQLERADTPAPAPVSNEPPPDTTASPPELDVAPASGLEDHAVALDIAAQLTDRDGSETLGVTIAGVPEGATLSAGTDLGDGAWLLTPADLPGLTITPPPDFSGTLNLTVTATSHEGGATSSVTSTLAVDIEAVADTPTLSATNASGAEDHAIALNIAASLSDTSETLGVTIAGVPDGATLSAGTDLGDGAWLLTPDDLPGLTITPPADFSGQIDLTVTATSTDGTSTSSATSNLTVEVEGVADTPTLNVVNATGTEDHSIPLDIAAGLSDVSESLGVTIAGVPEGGHLSAGTDLGDGACVLTPDDLRGGKGKKKEDYAGTVNLTVTST